MPTVRPLELGSIFSTSLCHALTLWVPQALQPPPQTPQTPQTKRLNPATILILSVRLVEADLSLHRRQPHNNHPGDGFGQLIEIRHGITLIHIEESIPEYLV